ncbi:MAG: hypothetical protein ABR616_05590 [Dermatophilaceae bacterium]
MTTDTITIDRHFDDGPGVWGYLATLPNGIARFAATPEAAEAKALLVEANYRKAGRLDEVVARLA